MCYQAVLIKAKAEVGLRYFEDAEMTLTRACQINGVTFDVRKLFIELFKKWEEHPMKGARMAFQLLKEITPDCSLDLRRKSFKDLFHFMGLIRPAEIPQVMTKEVLIKILEDAIKLMFLEEANDPAADELFLKLLEIIIQKSILDQAIIDNLWLNTLPTIQSPFMKDALFDMYVQAKESMSDRKTVAEVLLRGKESGYYGTPCFSLQTIRYGFGLDNYEYHLQKLTELFRDRKLCISKRYKADLYFYLRELDNFGKRASSLLKTEVPSMSDEDIITMDKSQNEQKIDIGKMNLIETMLQVSKLLNKSVTAETINLLIRQMKEYQNKYQYE